MTLTLTTKRWSNVSDPDLVQGCLDGNSEAWDEMVERFSRLIYSIPRSFGMCDADADDVHQEVFVTLFRRLETIREPERLAGWLIQTTRRSCYRVIKRTSRVVAPSLMMAQFGDAAEDQAERWERQHMVREALRRLGGKGEQLLTALFREPGEANYESIARQLSMRPGSIGPTRARVFAKLERILDDMGYSLPQERLVATLAATAS